MEPVIFDGDLAIVNPHTWLVVGDCMVQHRTQTAKRTASFDAGPGGMMIRGEQLCGRRTGSYPTCRDEVVR